MSVPITIYPTSLYPTPYQVNIEVFTGRGNNLTVETETQRPNRPAIGEKKKFFLSLLNLAKKNISLSNLAKVIFAHSSLAKVLTHTSSAVSHRQVRASAPPVAKCLYGRKKQYTSL